MNWRVVALSLAAGLLACSTPEPLESRVEAYWTARQARDAKASCRFEHPETGGDESTCIARMGGGPLLIHSFKVNRIEVDGDQASVDLAVQYRHAAMSRDVKGSITDIWVRLGNEWVHKPPKAMPESPRA